MHWVDIEHNNQDEVQPIIILYKIHKYVNADTYVTMSQWNNNPCTGYIYQTAQYKTD